MTDLEILDKILKGEWIFCSFSANTQFGHHPHISYHVVNGDKILHHEISDELCAFLEEVGNLYAGWENN